MKRGIPNIMMDQDNRAKRINPQLLPSTAIAVQQYTAYGGNISEPCSFGTDPLETNIIKKDIRYQSFCEVCNGCSSSYRKALKFLIEITYRLAHSS